MSDSGKETLTRRLAALHFSREPELSACIRWQPDHVDPQVIRVVRSDTRDHFIAGALVAKCFAIYHAGRQNVNYGGDTSLGKAMRALGTREPGTIRLFDRLLTANTTSELHTVLVQIIRALKPLNQDKPWQSPSWTVLHRDLIRWSDPQKRNDVRQDWAQAFVTFQQAQSTNTDS